MGIFDKLLGEFVDVIEWTDDSSDTMVYRFERYGNEIKYGRDADGPGNRKLQCWSAKAELPMFTSPVFTSSKPATCRF